MHRATILCLSNAFLLVGGSNGKGPTALLIVADGIRHSNTPVSLVLAVTIICLDCLHRHPY